MTDLRHMSLFRDVQAALEFQQMAEEGYLDTEFTMYGTVYIKEGKRHYLISADEEKILTFLEQAVFLDYHPLPVETLTEVCPVPLGEKQRIAQSLKVCLARRLAASFPEDFLQEVERYAALESTDEARPLLMTLYQQMRNTFDRDKILLTEQLVRLAYASKVLRKDSCRLLCQLLNEEKENLQCDSFLTEKVRHCFKGNQTINRVQKRTYQRA